MSNEVESAVTKAICDYKASRFSYKIDNGISVRPGSQRPSVEIVLTGGECDDVAKLVMDIERRILRFMTKQLNKKD